MKTEIEVKFLNIDIDEMREKLRKLGGVCEQPMRLMRRHVFHLVTPSETAFVRVRDEGDKATMTFKRFEGDDGLHAAKEAEVEVSDFETAARILEESGLRSKSYQETKRETWHIAEVEIMIDEWPWAPPFVEIEGPSEEVVRKVAADLGLDWKDAAFGGVASVYKKLYPSITSDVIVNDFPSYNFDDPVPKEFLGK
jgi:adenylate cyclase class 2